MKTPRESGAKRKYRLLRILATPLLVSLSIVTAHAASPIGRVMVATGAVTAQNPAGETRTLTKGSELLEQDRIKTADKSFAMLLLADDTKIAVRPNSEMVLEKFDQRAGQEAQELSVVKGGLRALTGAIGKQQPAAVKINTRYASIGIRGTEFIVRLCGESDCAQEEMALKQHVATQTSCPQRLDGTPAGGYIVDFFGDVYVQQGSQRVDLRPNEGAYTREGVLQCVDALPNFVVRDPFLIFPILPCESSMSLNMK
jgi:hypothetical protein